MKKHYSKKIIKGLSTALLCGCLMLTSCTKSGKNWLPSQSNSSNDDDSESNYTRLMAPSGLKYDAATSTISWNAVYGATGYTVNINGKEVVARQSSTSYKYDKFISGQSYLISVRALCSTEEYENSPYASIYYSITEVSTSDYTYKLADDGASVEITGIAKSANLGDTITIPNEVDGYTVSTIGNRAFYRNTALRTVIISEGITTIGQEAFLSTRIGSVTLPESLKSIEKSAFQSSRIAEVFLPKNIETLGASTFSENNYLKVVEFDVNSKLEVIPESCFEGTALQSVVLPASIVTIGNRAFASLNSLTSLKFSSEGRKSSLTTIGNEAFTNAVLLKDLVFPASLKEIGDSAFSFTSTWTGSYRTIMFEENSKIEKIGNSAFYKAFSGMDTNKAYYFKYFGPQIDLENLPEKRTIVLPATLKSIGERAFGNARVQTVDFENGSQLETIGSSAFYQAVELDVLRLPASLVSIKEHAFEGCSALENVDFTLLDSKLTEINSSAFSSTPWFDGQQKIIINGILIKDTASDGESLVIDEDVKYISNRVYAQRNFLSITLPNSLIGIYDEAFYKNESITSITIPSNVQFIGSKAFQECSLVDTVKFEANSKLESIGSFAFAALDKRVETDQEQSIIPFATITIPSSVKSIGASAFAENQHLKTVYFETNSKLESIGNLAFSSLPMLESFTVPASVKTIGASAFEATSTTRTSLVSFTFESGSQLVSIGASAFQNQALLTNFKLPDSVEIINENCFNATLSLSNFEISSNSKLKEIHTLAFYDSGITSFYVPASIEYIAGEAFRFTGSLTNITFHDQAFKNASPENRTIFRQTFAGCSSLVEVHLPEGIETISDLAFSNCTNLMTITTFASNISSNAFNGTAFYNSFENGLVVLNNIVITYYGVEEELVIPNGVVQINQNAFANKNLVSVELPASLHTIQDNAFANCNSLVTVSLPNNSQLEYIGANAFSNCRSLVDFNFSSTLNYIGTYAFVNCTSLVEIDLQDSKLAKIPFASFANCKSATKLTLPSTLQIIEDVAFYFNSIDAVTIPASVEHIGSYAFSFNMVITKQLPELSLDSFVDETVLTKVSTHAKAIFANASKYEYTIQTIQFSSNSKLNFVGAYAFVGSSVDALELPAKNGDIKIYLEQYSFAYATKLKKIKLDANISFDKGILLGASSINEIEHSGDMLTFTIFGRTINDVPLTLKKITISDGSTMIHNDAFNGYSFIEEITLPDSITSIGNRAFYNCNQLTSINLKNVVSIGDEAFYGCRNLETITYTDALQYIGNKAFLATKFLQNMADEEFVIINGILVLYQGNDSVVTLPSEVTCIAGGAFSGNSTVIKIIASENLTRIDSGAFDSTISLQSLVLSGSNVVEIGLNLFDDVAANFKVQVDDKQSYIDNNMLWSLYRDYLA